MASPYDYPARSAWRMHPRQRDAATATAGVRIRPADLLIVRVLATCGYAAALLALVNGVLQLTIAL